MTFYIYGLHLEGDSEIRYVGSTKRRLEVRLWGHINEPKRRDGVKNDWIRANPGRVRIKVLQTVEDDPKGAERKMVTEMIGKGHRLLNERQPRRLSKKEQTAGMMTWFDQHPD